MTDTITLTGLVATPPKHLITSEGLPIASFRLASTQRRYDRRQAKWVDGETNWYTITAFRQLAMNISASVNKGERVVVTGRLRIRDWTSAEKTGTNIEVDADSIGHDLAWGTASFTRNIVTSAASAPPTEDPAGPAEQPGAEAQPDDAGPAGDAGQAGDPGQAGADSASEAPAEQWAAASLPVPF